MSPTIHSVMAADGKVAQDAGANLHKTQLLEFYRLMVLSQELDRTKRELHRDGLIGMQIGGHGFEAIAIGAGFAAAPGDWVFPSWTFASVALARGVSPVRMLDNLFGNERDPSKGRQGPGNMSFAEENIVPVSGPVGTHIAQSVGTAHAAKIRGDKLCALCLFGAAAFESPDFHSGLNFAGVMQAPVVFVTTGTEEVGEAYGVESVHVDGSDVMAIYSVVAAACARARNGKGPTIVHAHPGDDASPLNRFAGWLEHAGLIDSKLEAAIGAEARLELRRAREDAVGIGFPDKETLFSDVTAAPGDVLEREAEGQKKFGGEYGGSADPDADFILG